MPETKATTRSEAAVSPSRVLGLFTPTGIAVSAVLAMGFLAMFFRWFIQQAQISMAHPEDWGHAFVIPLISGYLVWLNREKIAKESPSVFWPALVPFACGLVAYPFCVFLIQNPMTAGFSMILALGSLVLWMVGPGMFRHLFIPIAYLVMMVTISNKIMIEITFKLQLLASQGSWLILNLIGQPTGWFSVDIDGNTLEILTNSGEVLPMNVAEACSGMRMVVAFYALAAAVALIGCSQWWQRIALLLIAGPVAIFMNMIRVTVLGLLMLGDPNLATGDAHTMIGTILLVPSLLLFLGVVWSLNRIIRSQQPGLAS
ncbi:MAG: exosortase/archaeosortase family protein [Phycisphaerales bacterium]|nr:exosortase/archaeosortase family protein [Phycisphaerales bacterium]